MIFSEEFIGPIRSGMKTQTRRIAQSGHVAMGDGQRILQAKKSDGYPWLKVGNIYTVNPGRHGPTVGHIRILSIDYARLHDITNLDAAKEGFGSVDLFRKWWEGNYKSTVAKKAGFWWEDNPWVWVVDFEWYEMPEKVELVEMWRVP